LSSSSGSGGGSGGGGGGPLAAPTRDVAVDTAFACTAQGRLAEVVGGLPADDAATTLLRTALCALPETEASRAPSAQADLAATDFVELRWQLLTAFACLPLYDFEGASCAVMAHVAVMVRGTQKQRVVDVKDEGRRGRGKAAVAAAAAAAVGPPPPRRAGRRKRVISDEEDEEAEEGKGEAGGGAGGDRGGAAERGEEPGPPQPLKQVVAVPASPVLRSLTPDSATWSVEGA
jgi:hypothetical protein